MNKVKTCYESELKLKSLYFPELKVKRNKSNLCEAELGINISRNIKYISEEEAEITLIANILSKDDSINISVTLIGNFEFSIRSNSEFAKDILEKNTIAIMFPYLRSQVSLITTQPDMTPVVIPPINVNALIETQETE